MPALVHPLMEEHFCHCGTLTSLQDGDNGRLRDKSFKSSPALGVQIYHYSGSLATHCLQNKQKLLGILLGNGVYLRKRKKWITSRLCCCNADLMCYTCGSIKKSVSWMDICEQQSQRKLEVLHKNKYREIWVLACCLWLIKCFTLTSSYFKWVILY